MPQVFISYAHESQEHEELVRDLWIFLRQCGIDAKLDTAAAARRTDWALWMADQVRDADHVLVVASAAYRRRAQGQAGPDEGRGVQWEARLIRDAFYADQRALDRFVPVVLPGQSVEGVPDFLAPHSSTVYQVRDFTLAGADGLLRLLLNQPAEIEPPLGQVPVLGQRASVVAGVPGLRHEVELHVGLEDDGRVRTRTVLAGSVLGKQVAALPARLGFWQSELDSATGAERLIALGRSLWQALLDEPTGRRLEELIERGLVGSVVDVVVHLTESLSTLPVELMRLPSGRPVAMAAGVRLTRRMAGVDRTPAPPLPGPLKILAAVAAPDETATASPPLDVEAEMQALLDAVSDLDLGPAGAQVRFLEVASLPEIGRALAADQYHVLHLSAHGSASSVELEDEDGNPVPADAAELVEALRAGERPLPLVVLSSCRGAATGTAGVAAALVRHGADRVIAMQASVTDRFATELARDFYQVLAEDPRATVATALARARRTASDRILQEARGTAPRPEFAVPTLLAGGPDLPLRDPSLAEAPLRRPPVVPTGVGVRELPLGRLIGRRAQVRTAMAVLRGTARDRERFGDWAGVVLTGIGGIGKTAVAGRILARARERGWPIAEHIGPWNPAALIASVAEALPEQIAAALRDPTRADADKLSLVLRVLTQVRLVLLFDDFEQNLTPDGAFTDPGFAEIFTALCDAAAAGRILVTCRYPVPGLLRLELPALSTAELRRLFLRLPEIRALSKKDQQLVIRTIGGHPRLIEFLDVLLRHDTAASLRHVTTKLRHLASREGIDLGSRRDLTDGLNDVMLLGSRDILLDILLGQLTPGQFELALQASLSRASFTAEDLAHGLQGSDPSATSRDVQRLQDLTLLSTVDGEFVMHPWVATSLNRHQNDDQVLLRHERGAAMRLHRITTGRGRFDDIVDLIYHLVGYHNYDTAVRVAFEACNLVGGEVAVSALLAETVPLIPVEHRNYLALADRECVALQMIGLTSATTSRRHNLLSIAERHADERPADEQALRGLSISHEKLGDLAVAKGDTTTAEHHHQASMAIAERLAANNPSNAQYQRDLGVCHAKLADLAVAKGDTNTAEHHYRTSLAIRDQLATNNSNNAEYQRDLSVSHNKLGILAMANGDTNTAQHHHRTSMAIIERLAANDPSNAKYQRDLNVSHNTLGMLAAVKGDTNTAQHHYRTSMAIAEELAANDPSNVQYQRDVSVSHNKLGMLARAEGDTSAAQHHFQASRAIIERLAANDLDNAQYQHDLSISHNTLGMLARAEGDTSAAQHHFQASRAIIERLAANDPSNTRYQRDLSLNQQQLEAVQAMKQDGTES
ncbi:CHAT domain-containing protein [Lentzea sp. NPDC004789]